MSKRFLLFVGLVLALALWIIQPQSTQTADAQGQTRLVLAHYYAWFSPDSFNNGKTPFTNPSPYFSTDTGIIQRHVSQAQGIGIDGFVQAWYGPDASQQTEPNFANLLNIASNSGFKAAVSFEPISAFMPNNDVRGQALATLLATHANHPAYLRVDGKPVIFFWANWALTPAEWEYIRAIADPNRTSIWIAEGGNMQYIGVFDGMYIYNLAWAADPAGINLRWGGETRAASSTYGTYKYWVGTAMPGFNDSLLGRGDQTIVRDRGGGAYLQSSFSGAAQSGADMIVINSFNEWPEGSHIEPSNEFGDAYFNLTRDLISTYKAGGVPSNVNPVPVNSEQPAGSSEPQAAPQSDVTPLPTFTPGPTNTPAPTPTPTLTPTPFPDGRFVHFVEEGETLIVIAIQHDLTLDEIYELNDMGPTSLLSIGQEITVGYDSAIVNATATAVSLLDPTITPTPSLLEGFPNANIRTQDNAIVYNVQEGNTLIEIALLYNLEMVQIYELNGMDENSVLSVGQPIIVGYIPQPDAVAIGGSADLPLDAPTSTLPPTATATATLTPIPPTATPLPTIVSELPTISPTEAVVLVDNSSDENLTQTAVNDSNGLNLSTTFIAILLTVVGMLGLAGALLIYLGRKL